MTIQHYTVGMAGHIDHGKTTLTKALTGVDTDTLKEEIQRSITIEPGYAPFKLPDGMIGSIVDVPGHEKLIRQMIAGVAGIDLVLIVIAADEGVMPQTKEHFEILSFLGIDRGIFVFTKSDAADEDTRDYLLEELMDLAAGTPFERFPAVFADSVSMKGIPELKEAIKEQLHKVRPRAANGPFRMPVDHVFTVKGQGTVVRGTIMEGRTHQGAALVVAPGGKRVRVRQMQVHKEVQETVYAGQRAALNLAGIDKETIRRGHTIAEEGSYIESLVCDLVMQKPRQLMHEVKQRTRVKMYSGTSEVMGTLIFFDRNELKDSDSDEPVYCQIRLEQTMILHRGDRFVIRRLSPEETIGGGYVLDPDGKKYRFGTMTVNMLKEKAAGSPEDRILSALKSNKVMELKEIERETSLLDDQIEILLKKLEFAGDITAFEGCYMLNSELTATKESLLEDIHQYHRDHPLKPGIPRASLFSLFSHIPQKLLSAAFSSINQSGLARVHFQHVAASEFKPHFPPRWAKRMENTVNKLIKDGLSPMPFESYAQSEQLTSELSRDLKHYLLRDRSALALDEEHILSYSAFEQAVAALKDAFHEPFTVQEAKPLLGLSRKYVIPLLELMDQENVTRRYANNTREWQ
ncbi:selenocysteine-specific translation elongation factor [Fictibacillus iocasae]|uniref:Selenocysteine-specific elongation factor n=1 Tax=Fictibacillus iocasae TaxID=2715437 RepID=A0ABW2NN52_9BACL